MIKKYKVKPLVLIFLLGVISLSSVYSQQLERDITINIDVLRDYPFGFEELSYQGFSNFLKSPLKKNHIWLGSEFLEREINLETGEFSAIDDVLGYKVDGIYSIMYDLSKQDPFDDNIYWIYINGTGMIKFQKNTGSHRLFNIKDVESIEFTRNNVILEDGKGLIYLISKTTDWISVLDKEKEKIFSTIEVTDKPSNYCKHWLYPDKKYKQVNGGKDIWFYNRNQLYEYDTASGVLSKITYKPQIDIKKLEIDGMYLYLLSEDRFMIVNKKFLKEDVIIQQPNNPKELRMFKLEINNYEKFLNKSFDKQFNKLEQLYSTYSGSTNKYIINNFGRLNYGLWHIINDDDLRCGLKQKINDDIVDSVFFESILTGLVRYYYQKAKVDSALYYDSIFVNKYQDSNMIDEAYDTSVLKLKEVKTDMLKLDSLNLSGDVYLWEKADICRKLVGSDWNCGEVFCNTEVYFQFYKTLIEKYPQSEYADNAKFTMLKSDEQRSHEGEDQSSNLMYIEEYNRFLEEYPNTELMPDALYQLAGLYAYADVSWEKLYEFNKKALKIYLQIQDEFPDYQNRFLQYSINQINNALPALAFNLTIKSDKESYDIGDPINITIILENTFVESQSFEFQGFDSIPMAFLEIEKLSDERLHFASFSYVKTDWYKDISIFSLAPGEQHSEIWDITKKAFQWHYYSADYNLGYFILPEGKYKITAYNPLMANEYSYLHSESILIEVR